MMLVLSKIFHGMHASTYRLATRYLREATARAQRPKNNPLFFPTSRICLVVNGQRITARFADSIRFHINGTKHRRYLQNLNPTWTDTIWNSIDMEGFGIAFNSLCLQERRKTSKMLHGWWNTGHQRKKISPQADSQCASCGYLDETQEHILKCSQGVMRSTRYKALMKMRSNIVTTRGGSITWTTLHRGLTRWLEGDSKDQANCFPKTHIPEQLYKKLQLALEDQDNIGWEQGLRGYLSRQWLDAQQIEFPKSQLHALRRQWLKPVIKALWQFHDEMWTARNKILHDNSPQAQQIRESSIDEKIRHLYQVQESFAVSDQILFDMPLETRLRTSARSKKHWIVLVAKYHETTTARKIGNQPPITKYFTKMRNNSSESPGSLEYNGQDIAPIAPST